MQTAPDERTEMLKAAIAKCFAAREPVTPANVRKHVPEDFFTDFDSGENLADEIVFAEIQSTYSAAPHPAAMVEQTPDGRPLAPAPVEDFPNYLPPSDKAELPQTIAAVEHVEAAPAEQSTASHAASGPGQSPRTRLDAARKREGDLIAARPQLQNAQKLARAAVADAVRNLQLSDPHRQTPEQLSAEYRATSAATRATRAAREGGGGQDRIAFVDLERKYSQGGDANAMARRMNVNGGNRRKAFSRQSLGQINRDPSRGPVPAPVTTRPTIPALGK